MCIKNKYDQWDLSQEQNLKSITDTSYQKTKRGVTWLAQSIEHVTLARGHEFTPHMGCRAHFKKIKDKAKTWHWKGSTPIVKFSILELEGKLRLIKIYS